MSWRRPARCATGEWAETAPGTWLDARSGLLFATAACRRAPADALPRPPARGGVRHRAGAHQRPGGHCRSRPSRAARRPARSALWPTLRHLFPLWREQRRLVALGLACALVFTGLSLSIPILIQRTIDDAIDGDDTALLVPYLDAILVAAALRFGVNFTRRYATARIGIAVEARLRGMLYDAYLRFPRAFYDRHATGEVISRATNDIYPVRYFIGWGVVQAIQSVMMLVGAAIVLAARQRAAGALSRRSRCRRSPS